MNCCILQLLWRLRRPKRGTAAAPWTGRRYSAWSGKSAAQRSFPSDWRLEASQMVLAAVGQPTQGLQFGDRCHLPAQPGEWCAEGENLYRIPNLPACSRRGLPEHRPAMQPPSRACRSLQRPWWPDVLYVPEICICYVCIDRWIDR